MRSIYFILLCLLMISDKEIFAQKKIIPLDWSISGELPSSIGLAGPVTGVHNGVLFVGGGANFPNGMPWEGGIKKYHDQVLVFTKSGNVITAIKKGFKLPQNIAYPAVCASPLGLVYVGGENENGPSVNSYLIQWNRTSASIDIISLPHLPMALTNAAAACVGSLIYVVGGETKEAVLDHGWVLDLQDTAAGWKNIASMPKQISHMVFVPIGDKLYILGGRRKTKQGISELCKSVFAYDIPTNSWSSMPPLPYAICAGTGVALDKNGVLLFGGDRGTTFNRVEQLIVDIERVSDENVKLDLIKKKNTLQMEHPGFSREVLYYDVRSGNTIMVSEMPYPTPVTTSAFWWDGQIIIPTGEIKAGVRTPNILLVKM